MRVFAADFPSIQAAVDHVAAATTGATTERGGIVHLPDNATIDSPIVLPRSGSTPSGIVHLVGYGRRQTKLVGSASFPPGRALIEWAPTASRAWHQRISGLSLVLPDVAGVRAIHYKMAGTDFVAERAQIDIDDVQIEGDNTLHDSLIRIEGQLFFSVFDTIEGDCRGAGGGAERSLSSLDTTLIEFDTELHGASLDSDIVGFSYGAIKNIRAGVRRGGWFQAIKGKIKHTDIDNVWVEGGRVKPGLEIRNSINVTVRNYVNEGRSAPVAVIVNSRHIDFPTGLFVGSQDAAYPAWQASTAYVAGASAVIAPGWASAILPPAPANNNWYKATQSGTSGVTQLTWPTTVGSTVVDGGVVWECMGPAVQDAVTFDTCVDCRIDVRNSIGKPTNAARGVRTLRLINCTNVGGSGTVSGHPADEIAWGFNNPGQFRSARDGSKVTW